MELVLVDDDEHATLALVDAEQQQQQQQTRADALVVRIGSRAASDPWAQRTTRDRKRQRKEIEQLRAEAAALEAHATQLRIYFGSNSSQDRALQSSRDLDEHMVATTRSSSFTTAMVEFKRLQSAMQQNRALKAALDDERSVSAALIKVFQLQLSKQTLEFLTRTEKESHYSQEDDALTSSLSQMLVQLVKIHKRTDQMLAQFSTRNPKSVFSTSHSERDPERGPAYEFTMNTPVSCNYRQLEQFLWLQISTSVNLDCKKTNHRSLAMPRVKQELSNSHQQHLGVSFSETIEGRTLDSVFSVRKFVEANRVVFALASQFTFIGSLLVIREDAWVVVTDVTSESTHHLRRLDSETTSTLQANNKTLLQTHHRIYVETPDPHMTHEMEQLQDFVMNFQLEKIKRYQLQMQDVLIRDHSAVHRGEYQHELSPDCIACGFRGAGFQV